MPASSAPMARAPLEAERFRNWKLIGAEIIAAAVAIYLFVAWAPEAPGWAGLAAAVSIVLLLIREFRGISINSRGISFQRGRLERFPILSLGRELEVGAGGIRELMVMRPWRGFQLVQLEGWFGAELLVFQSRDQRRRFMTAFEKICPNVPICGQSSANRAGARESRTAPSSAAGGDLRGIPVSGSGDRSTPSPS
jgi:hypothetical protein